MDSPSTSSSSRNKEEKLRRRRERERVRRAAETAGQKERRLKQRRERETEQDVLLKVSSKGRSDYIGRVLPNVRDRQLKLLTTEKPEWRDGEQLTRGGHIHVRGGSRNLRRGVLFKRVRAERAEKFWVTTPTFPNHAHFN